MDKNAFDLFLKYGVPATASLAVTVIAYSLVSPENKQTVLLGGVGSLIGTLFYLKDSNSSRNHSNDKVKFEQPGPNGFIITDYQEPHSFKI